MCIYIYMCIYMYICIEGRCYVHMVAGTEARVAGFPQS